VVCFSDMAILLICKKGGEMKYYIQYLDSKGFEVLALSGQGGRLDGRLALSSLVREANDRMEKAQKIKPYINGYEIREGSLNFYNVVYRTF